MSDEEPWEPLTFVDYLMLGMVGTFQAVALGMCIHLIRWRKWPPYVTKNVDIVIIMTLAGFAWTFASALQSGLIPRNEGDFLAICYIDTTLSWSTLAVHIMSFAVRVYRMWRILIKHDDSMWPAKYQVMLMSSISLGPLLAAVLVPDLHFFDEAANSCNTTTDSRNVVLAMNALGLYLICYLWFVCTRQLRWVRKQFNEYEAMKWTLSCLTLLLFSYAAVVAIILNNQHVLVRRVAIVYPVLSTYTLLWGSIGEPVVKKLTRDEDYLWSFTKGFSEMPSPAQAATMRIVEQYIREGSPDQVNISGECREEILSTDVTAYDIFDRARAEVLAVMETNFQRDFVETEGFRRIADASELEQREIRLFRAEGVLVPSASPTPVRPGATRSSFSPRGRLLDSFRRLPVVGRLFSSSSPLAVGNAVACSSSGGDAAR